MATGKSALWVPERAEIIFIQYSPAVGDEIPDDHPMLVMSTKAFNERTGLVVGFPMTHSPRHANNPFAIVAPGANGEPGYVLTHQPKSFDWRVRNARPHLWGAGHTKLLAAALRRFDAAFGVCAH
jgi:mRNA interferase MazF